MNNYVEKIILLCGLPGSGKSTWANKRIRESYSGSFQFPTIRDISLDGCECDYDVDKIIDDRLCYSTGKTVIVDGLFLTNDVRVKILNKIGERISHAPDIEIYEWKENREACLSNDLGRRDLASTITIKNAVWEPVYLSVISEGLKFEYHTLTLDYFDVKVYSLKEKIICEGYDGKLRSESWCGGGTWGNCWGNSGTVAAEPPVEFTELDDLLSKVCPNITFLQYKRLLAKCVETEESCEHDYYGGSTTNYQYVCDLKKLADFIEEL